MRKYTVMLIFLILPFLLTGCLNSETVDVQEFQKNQQELQQLKAEVEILESKINEYNENVTNMEKSLSENGNLIVNPKKYYIENNIGTIEFEIINSESDVYGFEIIKYKEDGNAILIIPEYQLEILPNKSQYDSKIIRLKYNDNKEYPKLIVMIYEFKTGRFEQLVWEHVSDI